MTDFPKCPELMFDEMKHVYTLEGMLVPSVTAVMRPLSNVYYGGIDETVLNAAAKRGTEVHQAIENFLLFGIEDIPSEHEGYYKAFKDWWKEYDPQLIETESRVYHKILRYAGTADLACIFRQNKFADNEVVLIDFKTSAQIVDMLVRVQLEAYSKAYESHGFKFDSKAIVHLQKDGKYDMKMFQAGDSEAWEVFGSLLTVHNYLKNYWR